jgi:hypothetical protein
MADCVRIGISLKFFAPLSDGKSGKGKKRLFSSPTAELQLLVI